MAYLVIIMADSKRYYFTLNPQKPREKIIKDFIEGHIEPKATIKEILYKVAIGEYSINGETISNKQVIASEPKVSNKVSNQENKDNQEISISSDVEIDEISSSEFEQLSSFLK